MAQIPDLVEATVLNDADEVLLRQGGVDKRLASKEIFSPTKTILPSDTLADAIARTDLKAGHAIELKERTTGNGGGASWDAVLAASVTINGSNIVQCVGVPSLALFLRLNKEVTPEMIGLSTATPRNNIAAAINLITSIGGTFLAPFGFIVDSSQLTNPELVNTFAGLNTVKSNRGVSIPTGRLNNRIELVAHRGGRNVIQQNTLIAWSQCLSLGFDAWEGDVQITADGIPVMFHDPTVDALTDGTGAISSLTLIQVEALRFTDLQSTQFLDVKIPTLEEAITLAAELGVKFYLEIKEYRTAADITLMNAVVDGVGMSESVNWLSFIMQDLIDLRALNKTSEISFHDASVPTTSEEDTLALLGNAYMFVEQSVVLNNTALVKKWKQLGFGVAVFTPNSAEFIVTLQRLGVDSIVTDNILWGLN